MISYEEMIFRMNFGLFSQIVYQLEENRRAKFSVLGIQHLRKGDNGLERNFQEASG